MVEPARQFHIPGNRWLSERANLLDQASREASEDPTSATNAVLREKERKVYTCHGQRALLPQPA